MPAIKVPAKKMEPAMQEDVSGRDCHVSAIYHPNSPGNVIDRKGSLLKFLKEK